MALRADGTVWAWGFNGSGQIGDGTRTTRTTPVKVTGLNNVVDVVAGAQHSMALLADGTVMTWGENSRGNLGLGNTTDRLNATPVPGISNGAEIDAGVIIQW